MRRICDCERAMTTYRKLQGRLIAERKTWLMTGAAGFFGSILLETLLTLNQRALGLHNFSTGYRYRLDDVQSMLSSEQWENFRFVEGDIRHLADCQEVCQGVDYAPTNPRSGWCRAALPTR